MLSFQKQLTMYGLSREGAFFRGLVDDACPLEAPFLTLWLLFPTMVMRQFDAVQVSRGGRVHPGCWHSGLEQTVSRTADSNR